VGNIARVCGSPTLQVSLDSEENLHRKVVRENMRRAGHVQRVGEDILQNIARKAHDGAKEQC